MPAPDRIPAQPQDAFNDYARVVADQQLGVVLELPSRLDPDRLAQAVADVIAAQPVLGCRFVARGRRAWHEPVPDAAERALSVISAPDAWEAAMDAAGQPLLDPFGPHLAVTLVHGDGGCAGALGVRVDHSAADGQGAKACVELLASAYSGGSAACPAATAPPDRSWRRLRRAAGLTRMLRAALGRTDLPPTWGLPSAGGSPGRRRHVLATIPRERFSARRQWGKARGFTVNDLVLAGFYRAMFSALDTPADQDMVLRVSFDQRRYLPDGDPMPAASNLSSLEPLALSRVPGEPFEATAGRVHAEMERLKASSPGLGNALLLETLYGMKGYDAVRRDMVAQMERGQRAGRSYPFLSNFGVLDPERLRFGDVTPARAVMLPVAGHPPFAMLGASSYLDALTLSMGFADAETDAALPQRILGEMAAELSE